MKNNSQSLEKSLFEDIPAKEKSKKICYLKYKFV